MKIVLSLLLLASISISCNKSLTNDPTDNFDLSDEKIQKFLHLTVNSMQNILQFREEEELESKFIQIENIKHETNSLTSYCESASKVLDVSPNVIREFVLFSNENSYLYDKDVYHKIIVPSFKDMLDNDQIALKYLNESVLHNRDCAWWEAGLAVLTGAGTLLSCGVCVAGGLPSCVPCGVGAVSTVQQSKKCFFN